MYSRKLTKKDSPQNVKKPKLHQRTSRYSSFTNRDQTLAFGDISSIDNDEAAYKQIFFDQFCFDLLKLYGLLQLQEFNQESFSNAMRDLFREVTVQIQQGKKKTELRIKDF